MTRSIRITILALVLAIVPAIAHAQLSIYKPSKPAVGETYHVEVGFGFWNPPPDISISSSGGALSLIGSKIDAMTDLGFEQKKLPELQVVVRLAQKHKFRFEYLPIKYAADAVVQRTIVFQGNTYTVGLPVSSSVNWKGYRFGYEYDFAYGDRGFAGFIADVRYEQVSASLSSFGLTGTAQVHTPLPALGGILRAYVTDYISISGEVTGFALPGHLIANNHGHFIDWDVYGTANFTDHVGAKGGYRSLDITYEMPTDNGALKMGGWYIQGIVRF